LGDYAVRRREEPVLRGRPKIKSRGKLWMLKDWTSKGGEPTRERGKVLGGA